MQFWKFDIGWFDLINANKWGFYTLNNSMHRWMTTNTYMAVSQRHFPYVLHPSLNFSYHDVIMKSWLTLLLFSACNVCHQIYVYASIDELYYFWYCVSFNRYNIKLISTNTGICWGTNILSWLLLNTCDKNDVCPIHYISLDSRSEDRKWQV